MSRKVIAWVLKSHQKIMKELYSYWEVEFVNSADELIKNYAQFSIVVVSLSKVRSFKIVNCLKQIKKIFYIEVDRIITSPMLRAQENSEYGFAPAIIYLEEAFNVSENYYELCCISKPKLSSKSLRIAEIQYLFLKILL